MAQPYSAHKAKTLQAQDPILQETRLLQVVRDIQVDQLDLMQSGCRGAAVLSIATQPTAGDTILIGDDTYEFVANAGAVADDEFIAVEIAGNVAGSVANLVAAINATDADNAHANITNVATDAPALANGTQPVVADIDLGAALVRVRYADAPGGALRSPARTFPSLALSETLDDGTDAWMCGDVNMNTLGATAAGQLAMGVSAYTADNIAASDKRVFSFPFTVTMFTVQVRAANGKIKTNSDTDLWTLDGTDVVLTIAAANTEIVDTDVITVTAYGA